VVDCACLENKSAERYQGFESPSLLQINRFHVSEALPLLGMTSISNREFSESGAYRQIEHS